MKKDSIYRRFVTGITNLLDKIPMPKFLKRFVTYSYISYVIVGVMTTIINYIVFFALFYLLGATGMEEKLVLTTSEVVAFIISVLFSYFPNKIAVFDSYDFSFKKVIIEMFLFYMSRIFSLLAELLILLITVTNLGWNEVIMKIIASVVVIVLNYLFSKMFVFKKSLLREKPKKEKNDG